MALSLPRAIRKTFEREEEGSLSVLALYFLVASVVLGGLAVDFANRTAKESKLQSAADSVGHAALYLRETRTEQEAKAEALDLALSNLPAGIHGDALVSADIEFGVWDRESRTFTAQSGSNLAVRVQAVRSAERGNAISNLLLRAVGVSGFETLKPSVWETYRPDCFREGFVANAMVDIQSNNAFVNGFCIHSNGVIKLSSNNTFEAGTLVSLPNTSDVQQPASGEESNNGFSDALRSGAYRLRILNKLDEIMADVQNGGSEYAPDYVSGFAVNNLTGKNHGPSSFVRNRINYLPCVEGQQMNLLSGDYSEIVFVTNCKIKFQNGVTLEDAMMISTSYNSRAMNAPQGLRLGRDDNCAEGGGAVLLTNGGFEAASGLEAYGAQIIARRDISFTANADGIQGVSMISGDTVSGTANGAMGFCGGGMTHIFEVDYYRMVG